MVFEAREAMSEGPEHGAAADVQPAEVRYFNRELSWLAFNQRVLAEARNPNYPLLERLRFLSISGSNLDEFLMVRVAGLAGQVRRQIEEVSIDGRTPSQQLAAIHQAVAEIEQAQQDGWRELRGLLADKGIVILGEREALSPARERWLGDYFDEYILPIITPQAIDPAHPFPFIANQGMGVLFALSRVADDAPVMEMVLIPSALPRFIRLPGEAFARLLERKPELLRRARADMADRRQVNSFIEGRKENFSGAVDLYSETAQFLIDNGVGEATDVLLIDEKLCVGCDNCEKACADSHEGLSRLNREAGTTFAGLHVPTSCRHCEHPHCMADCPPNAIHRGADGEVFIDDSCIGCGNCQRNCPYGVIRMDSVPPPRPSLLKWLFLGEGPGPGEPTKAWRKQHAVPGEESPKKAIKCDMCSGIDGGPACVRACPTGAAIRVSPETFLSVARMGEEG